MGRSPYYLLGLIGIITSVPVATASWSFAGEGGTVRQESSTADFLIGNLTWKDGQGGIAWNHEAPSEDDHGPADDPLYFYKYEAESETGVNAGAHQPDDVFVSEPLAKDLHLNASRAIQFDLLYKLPQESNPFFTPPCSYGDNYSGIFVKLEWGTRLVAGSLGGTSITNVWGDPVVFGPQWSNPPGYNRCPFRFPTEVAMIPAGERIKLTVIYDHPSVAIRLGLAEEHRTQLRIPVYPDWEVAYRDPVQAGSDPTGLSGPAATTSPSLSAALLLPMAGIALGRGGNRRVAALLLVVALIPLAGCLGGRAHHAADSSSNALGEARQTVSGGGFSAKGLGSIVGLVHDDLHVPIAKAHVSILGTATFTESDGHGRFQINDVPPGAFGLRVDRSGYHSLETSVSVEADKLTHIDILLLPLTLKESDFRPHHHDYWEGRDIITVMDNDIGKECLGVDGSCNPRTVFSLPDRPEPAKPNVIIPGTYETELALSWDEAKMGQSRFGIKVEDNTLAFDGWNQNESIFWPRAKGEAFHIATNWEMADVGHQPYSYWRFTVYLPSEDQPGLADLDYYAGQAQNSHLSDVPTFHVKVTLHKGVLPLEPSHPDQWKGVDQLQVGKISADRAMNVLNLALEDALVQCPAGQETLGGHWGDFTVGKPAKVVPASTTWVDIKATFDRDSLPHFNWILYFKPADTPPLGYFVDTSQGFRKAPDPTVSGLTYSWKFAIKPEEADNLYAKKTAWFFLLRPDDEKLACLDSHTFQVQHSTSLLPSTDFHVAFNVIAHKDAGP